MLIILIGASQSGKNTLAQHLVDTHSYTRVRLPRDPISELTPTTHSTESSSDFTSNSDLHFDSSTEFLDYATRYWKVDYVTTDLRNAVKLHEFSKRPFVAIVAVEAPLSVRYSRTKKSTRSREDGSLLNSGSLESFVESDDISTYGALPASEQRDEVPPPTATTTPNTSAHARTALVVAQALDRISSTPPPTHLSPSADAPPSPSPSPRRAATPLRYPHEDRPDPLIGLLPLANLTIQNPYSDPAPFLRALSLPKLQEALRPSWDPYFMLLASLASLRSNCMKRRVGAVLVREKRVVSTGYNGTPRGVRNCNDGGCGRCNSGSSGRVLATNADHDTANSTSLTSIRMGEGLNECLCLHAEENALLEAGRERVSGGGTEGAILYCNTCPCLRCTVKIVQCGVIEVVYSLSYSMDAASRRVLEEAGVGLRQIKLPVFP
ncbi:BZ3500_MvSof-1268-A1-R1_Chr3-2g06227 [Microbotryum saponariae]|uniref:Deoxycytidylate deaminase n=1 Tax=Microbotryum saponariae TaxID=289078 RepID=A0A2X0L0B7_9BASI|nr:BZ3500_MvSof-1268-A1-R1_Chr3-2g06227 [Microbotryum saponariae]SDA04162.1 BZ3501_MvSof-1269-A2-R1_Chr3-2g05918 [Microbotryum saponariae]